VTDVTELSTSKASDGAKHFNEKPLEKNDESPEKDAFEIEISISKVESDDVRISNCKDKNRKSPAAEPEAAKAEYQTTGGAT
jgi:hypothetical protein